MDKNCLPAGARAAALELIELLQRAHFAARRLEVYVPSDRDDRLVDQIHAIRVRAEHLRPSG